MADAERDGLQGVQFAPIDGKRSSTTVAKSVFSDAVATVDPILSGRIAHASNWRKQYMGPVRDVVVAGISSPKNALRIAADGLDALHRNLTFVDESGDEQPLRAALSGGDARIEARTLSGQGAHPGALRIPVGGRELEGDALLGQLENWARAGVIDASCAAAVGEIVRAREWLDLSDLTFVMLGAASQMGPMEHLLAWGAHVIAIDLPRPQLWEHILDCNVRGSGRLSLPVHPTAGELGDVTKTAGVDLMTELPAVAEWIRGIDEPYTIGNYIYADGATFVRLAGGADTLIAQILDERDDVSLAYLATPTDVFAVPANVVNDARARRSHGVGRSVVNRATGGRLYKPNFADLHLSEDGKEWGISDCLVPIQGPNYALAKSLQRWRAVLAREEGHLSSANVAPATRTASVTKNKMLAAAYRGAGPYGVDVFEPETSRALMAALLVHDLRAESSSARPETPLDHPYRLFTQGAAHGGIWNLGHEPRTVLPLALLRGMVGRS